MNKRGQVTIFLVVGIVLLFVSAGVYMVVNKSQTGSFILEEEESHFKTGVGAPLVSFIENCIEERAVQGIEIVGLQGGFIFPTEDDVLLTEEILVGYVYKDNTKTIDKSFVENELGVYVDLTLNDCIQDFTTFSHLYQVIESGNFLVDDSVEDKEIVEIPFSFPSFTRTKINDDIVKFNVEYPLEVTRGDDNFVLHNFIITVPAKIGSALNIVAETVSSQTEKNTIDFNLLCSFEPLIKVFPFDEENTIYSLYYGEEQYPEMFLYAINNKND